MRGREQALPVLACSAQTVDLVQRLRAQGVPFEQVVLPDEIHGFLMYRSWLRTYEATADFFDRTLKQRKRAPENGVAWASRE